MALLRRTPDAHAERMAPGSTRHRRTSQPLTVCLVEDHARLRDQLSEILSAEGMHVVGAVGTVSDGKAMIERRHPDVAVIDNRLPDGRGIDLCRDVSRSLPGTALILHTGEVTSTVVSEGLEAGAVAVIAKSTRSGGLIDAIKGSIHGPPHPPLAESADIAARPGTMPAPDLRS